MICTDDLAEGPHASMRDLIRRRLSIILSLARLVLALLILWQGARFVFRIDPLDDLRRADVLFSARRYHAARAAYAGIVARAPRYAPPLVRLGMVYVVRDERGPANETLAYAIG